MTVTHPDIAVWEDEEAGLMGKLRPQRLLADLSACFAALHSENLDEVILEIQKLVVKRLELDRSTFWQIAENDLGFICTHSWQRPGWHSIPPNFSSSKRLPWSQAKILRGETLCFSSIDDLPPEAARDAELFRQYGPKSNVTFPLSVNGRIYGALAFGMLRTERRWQEDEITELGLIAQIIGNVVRRHRAELREEQLRTELAHAMRVASLGELTATLAHELNQPLAAILSNAQAARRFLNGDGISNEELLVILDDIVRDNKRAGGVIQSLRAMVSKQSAVRGICCLNELVTEVLDLMRGEIIEAGIEVRSRLDPGLPQVNAVRVELQQVLMNLILNAIHAMKSTPSEKCILEMETCSKDGMVMVVIRDYGPGVSVKKLPAIFDSFFSTKEQGLGMGLSICRRIIENHSGCINVKNHAEGGAVFSFTLPIQTQSGSGFAGNRA